MFKLIQCVVTRSILYVLWKRGGKLSSLIVKEVSVRQENKQMQELRIISIPDDNERHNAVKADKRK